MTYKHTQIGYLIIIVLIIPLLILFFTIIFIGSTPVLLIVFFVLLLVLALFYSLTVEINQTELIIKFGFGLINSHFYLTNIQSCRVVKNH